MGVGGGGEWHRRGTHRSVELLTLRSDAEPAGEVSEASRPEKAGRPKGRGAGSRLPRLHLFELADQGWFPHLFRNYLTDVLQFLSNLVVPRAPVVPLLQRLLEKTGAGTIVDLCSGSSGPAPFLRQTLEAECGRPVSLILTDKYPNVAAFETVSAGSKGRVVFRSDSVDAMSVPPELPGVRTLFASLHHFRPEQARAILADAARRGRGIGVFEGTERTVPGLLIILLAPLYVLVGTPFFRPFRFGRLFWTYLVPIVPLVTLWDGLVSALRTYSPEELRALAESAGAPGYVWEVGQEQFLLTPPRLTYLLGYPAKDGAHALQSPEQSGAPRPRDPGARVPAP